MFNKYIPQLKEAFTVPEGCVIAGGAVANTVFNLYHGHNAPVRDVDVYHFETNAEDSQATLQQIVAGEYDSLRINGMLLKGVAEDEDGLHQHIYLNTPSNVVDKMRIVDSFDLNCVQIAFDGNKLYWTPEFEEFVKTKQLEILWVHNTKTVFRLFKKRDDLGAYLPYEMMLELFAQLQLNQNSGFNPYMSDSYIDHVAEWIPELKKRGVVIVNNKINFPMPRYHLGRLISVRQMISLVKHVVKMKKGNRQKFQDLIKTHPNVGALLRDHPTWFRHDISNAQWDAIEHVYSNHPLMYSGFTGRFGFEGEEEYIYDIDDHIALCEMLYEQEKKYGLLVYGVVEGLPSGFTDNNIKRAIDASVINLNKVLTRALPKVSIEFFEVTELVTGGLLVNEGLAQHHCVGGYGNKISKGGSRIFSLKNLKTRESTTLELHVNMDITGVARFSIAQHRGFANSNPSDLAKNAAKVLTDKLNALNLVISGNGDFPDVLF